MTHHYLLEIGCEEIPSRFMQGLLTELKEKTEALLQKNNIGYKEIKTLGTYRRLALIISELESIQPKRTEALQGPPARIAVGPNKEWLPPAIGFAKKCNVDISQLTLTGDYITVSKEEGGQKTADILPTLITDVITSLTLPIAMRWGHETRTFIRPIHWMVSLLDQQELPISPLFSRRDTSFSTSKPHRFLEKNPVKIQSAQHYEQALETAHVTVNQAKRYDKIKTALLHELKEEDIDTDLLEEVVFLTECPVVLKGSIDPKYLQIPQQVIIQCMKKHQKFFPAIQNNVLQANFFAVADNITKENQSTILAGYERVLTARLEDAKFFWEEDQKELLEHFVPKLKTMVFQKGLGSLQDKIDRMLKLANHLNTQLNFNIPHALLTRAVTLCKADLASQMVFELPDLQGTMGGLYAKAQGEPELISNAIQEHYHPRFAGDTLPQTQAGILLSIADKADTIVACFQNNLIPTGSQDPWGVRRAIYALLQITYEHTLTLSVEHILTEAYKGFHDTPKNHEKLTEFFTQRLRSFLIEKNLPYDIVDALLDSTKNRSVQTLHTDIQTVETFRKTHPDNFKVITEAAVRIRRLAEKATTDTITPNLFKEEIEEEVWAHAKTTQTLEDLQSLSSLMTTYFEKVLVMDKDQDIQKNRLATLKKINTIYQEKLGNPEKIIIS